MKNASSEEICRRQAFARILTWQYFRLFQQNRSKAAVEAPCKPCSGLRPPPIAHLRMAAPDKAKKPSRKVPLSRDDNGRRPCHCHASSSLQRSYLFCTTRRVSRSPPAREGVASDREPALSSSPIILSSALRSTLLSALRGNASITRRPSGTL